MKWPIPPWIIALVLAMSPASPRTAQEALGRTEAPPAVSTPSPTDTPRPGPSYSVGGKATWYRYVPGQAAAGPDLRRALGKSWRGSTVQVQGPGGRVVVVRLTDWCACPGGRIIDLDLASFARLAPPSRGVLKVSVEW
jgi:hypothetical protein